MSQRTQRLLPLALLVPLAIAAGPAWAGDADYATPFRPRYHFTPRRGFMNDPVGLLYHHGLYHLFFQHGTLDRKAWGHATSADLLHWTEHGDALSPADGHPAFSGSAVVDAGNTSGLGVDGRPPLVAIFTAWGDGQHLAYSTDDGRTWQRYGSVLSLPADDQRSFPLTARDPRVFRHEPTGRWVMVLYRNMTQTPGGKGLAIYTSPNLRDWTFASSLAGYYVCPDLFALPVEGEPGRRRWVLLDWDRTASKVAIGTFDGQRFTAEVGPLPYVYGAGHHGATQTWPAEASPRGRVIQIVNLWHGRFPGEAFENQMSVPLELSLRRTPAGLRLCRRPLAELASLHERPASLGPWTLNPGRKRPLDLTPESRSFDLQLRVTLPEAGALHLEVLGLPIVLNARRVAVGGHSADLPGTSAQEIRVLADVTSVEVFVNRGEVVMLHLVDPPATPPPLRVWAAGDAPLSVRGRLRHLGSIWPEPNAQDGR